MSITEILTADNWRELALKYLDDPNLDELAKMRKNIKARATSPKPRRSTRRRSTRRTFRASQVLKTFALEQTDERAKATAELANRINGPEA